MLLIIIYIINLKGKCQKYQECNYNIIVSPQIPFNMNVVCSRPLSSELNNFSFKILVLQTHKYFWSRKKPKNYFSVCNLLYM